MFSRTTYAPMRSMHTCTSPVYPVYTQICSISYHAWVNASIHTWVHTYTQYEEVYFQTVQHNSHFCELVVNEDLRFINWAKDRDDQHTGCMHWEEVDWCGNSPQVCMHVCVCACCRMHVCIMNCLSDSGHAVYVCMHHVCIFVHTFCMVNPTSATNAHAHMYVCMCTHA